MRDECREVMAAEGKASQIAASFHLRGEDNQSRVHLSICPLPDSTSTERRMLSFSHGIFCTSCTTHSCFSTGPEILDAQISFSSPLNLVQ